MHELIADGLDPVYVLHSEHPILIERAVSAIRDATVPPATRGFNYDVIEGKPKGSQIVSLAQTLPMMAQKRMVFVRDLGLLPADEAEPVIEYLGKPNPSTVLVAVTSKLDAPRQVGPWVRDEAKAQNVKIDQSAISRLIDTVGNDLSRLALSIGQLGLFAGDRPVTSDDVDELIADTRERSVFELTDAIGAGDRKRALSAVASLCDQRESAVGVVVMLARHIRQLSMLHTMRLSHVPRPEWASRVGVPPFVIDKLIQQAKGYTPAALAQATQRLANADRALKGDITLSTQTSPWTGPQLKALGRELAERVILEQVVDGIVGLAG